MVIKITSSSYSIISSDNQELIHHIDCFGWMFYHQSTTKIFCSFHKFLFYDFYFGLYNIFASTKNLYIHRFIC